MKQSRVILLLLAGLALLSTSLAGCGQPTAASGDTRLMVVTTTGQIADTARRVGGDNVNVISLMGPGVDPHLYVATISDVDKLRNADIILYNGLFLEAQMDSILEQLAERRQAVAVSDGIDRSDLRPSASYADEFDPHIWFDVTLWMQTVETVRDALAQADPANATVYRSNAATYLDELAALDTYVRDQAARVPAEQRVLVTAHDAFSYFGQAYDFEVLGLQGISTASEAGTADVQHLAEFIAARRIPAVFIESSVPVRNIEAVQAAVRDRGFDVTVGGQLFSDAMGDAGTPEGTYVGMVRHNIDTIVAALLGARAGG